MRDEDFIRGEVPMTKSEVRAVSVSKLELDLDSIVYDVGAGTGSVSIEVARALSTGMVYAIEHKEVAVGLIEQNKVHFQVENITVVHKKAPEAFDELPVPTHAFIGGSSGNMVSILDTLLSKNETIRIVITVLALETLAQVTTWLKERSIEAEVVSVQVSKARVMGGFHLMLGQNPVYVISFGGRRG